MTHGLARSFFATTAVATACAILVALTLALTPKPVPGVEEGRVALTRFDALAVDVPVPLTVPGLSVLAPPPALGGSARNRTADLPLYLVRRADTVRAFIGFDPRTGCRLEYWGPEKQAEAHWVGVPPSLAHDVCHGTIYDIDGRPIAGPGPYYLDELVINVGRGIVFADATKRVPRRVAYTR